ncbi:MAG TPA: NfeD family protein [Desulfobacterales bacterium]|nr:NfeD family protein [Desulfobacterales bacterium]
MIEQILISISILAAIALLASVLASDILAPVLALLHEWFNKRFGFPRNVKTGSEGLINQLAVVNSEFEEDEFGILSGKVFLKGELWQAKVKTNEHISLKSGDKVKVTGVKGLMLEIDHIESPVAP